jgi:hypothetical protein
MSKLAPPTSSRTSSTSCASSTKKFEPADEALAVAMAEKSYPGGGRSLAEMLDDIRNARPVKV